MTVGELGRRMDSRELSEWLARERFDPLPDFWYAAGMVCATIANVMGSGKRRCQPWDFFPWLRPERAPASSSMAALARFDALTARRNGKP